MSAQGWLANKVIARSCVHGKSCLPASLLSPGMFCYLHRIRAALLMRGMWYGAAKGSLTALTLQHCWISFIVRKSSRPGLGAYTRPSDATQAYAAGQLCGAEGGKAAQAQIKKPHLLLVNRRRRNGSRLMQQAAGIWQQPHRGASNDAGHWLIARKCRFTLPQGSTACAAGKRSVTAVVPGGSRGRRAPFVALPLACALFEQAVRLARARL